MAQRKNLLTVDYHYDDETGMYRVGEIDFGVSGNLEKYIERYGYEGVKNILATLGHLAYEVKKTFYEQPVKNQGINAATNFKEKSR